MTNLASSLLKNRKNNDSIVDEAVNILKEAVTLNPTSENIVFTLGSKVKSFFVPKKNLLKYLF